MRLVVVGGSLAGHRAALEARRRDEELEIIVVGDEPDPPYQRPPLSKGFLAGTVRRERLALRSSPGAYDLRLDTRAEHLDLSERVVHTNRGVVAFDLLVIATGASPLRPTSLAHPHVLTLRTLSDAVALRARLEPYTRLVTVGAGFIGLEVAATARERGASVHIVEADRRLLPRALGAGASAAIARWHEQHGVSLTVGATVAEVTDDGALLDTGSLLAADSVLVATGVRPNIGWLDHCLPTDPRLGVLADEYGRVGEGVVAAGDVTTWRHPGWDKPVRSEHFETAATQGVLAARTLLGSPTPWRDVPFGWSDQHGHLVQILGLPGPDAEEEQRSPTTYAYYRGERLEGFVLLDGADELVDRREELEVALGLR